MKHLLLLSCALTCLVACYGESPKVQEEGSEAVILTPNDEPTAVLENNEVELGKILPGETQIERQERERYEILTSGYWEVEVVMEAKPTQRYQANKGRMYRLNDDDTYAMYDPTGKVIHSGTWTYERRGNKQHYVTLAATQQQYNNEFRVYLMKDAAVFVGTDKYDNSSLQMKTSRRETPPFAVN